MSNSMKTDRGQPLPCRTLMTFAYPTCVVTVSKWGQHSTTDEQAAKNNDEVQTIVSSSRGLDPGTGGTSRGAPNLENPVPGCPSQGQKFRKETKFNEFLKF